MINLDKQDRRLLGVIQKDNSLSYDAIGEMVNMSASAVRRQTARDGHHLDPAGE